MADFVAVIRRTVDGLSDNSPDMRAKVYEKARGAVRRQLENMKPRPSDDMIDRQMAKLEAAIGEVEAVHAAPAEPEPVEAAPAEAHFEQPPVPYDVSSTQTAPAPPAEPTPVEPDLPEPPPAPAWSEPTPEIAEAPATAPDDERTYEEPAAYAEATPSGRLAEPVPATPVHDWATPAAEEAIPAQDPETPEADEPRETVSNAVLAAPRPAYDPWEIERDAAEMEPYPALAARPAAGDDGVDDGFTPLRDERAQAYDENDAEALPADEDDWARPAPEPDRDMQALEAADDGATAPAMPAADYDFGQPSEPVVTDHAAFDPEPALPQDAHPQDLPAQDPKTRDTSWDAPAPAAMPSTEWELPEWQDSTPAVTTRDDTADGTFSAETFETSRPAVSAHVETPWTQQIDDDAILEEFEVLASADSRAAAAAQPLPELPPVSGGVTPEGEPTTSWSLDDADPFQQPTREAGDASAEPAISDWSWPVDRSAVSTGEVEETEDSRRETWDEIDALLSTGAAGAATGAAAGAFDTIPAGEPAPLARPASYRAAPRKSVFSVKRIAAALVLLLVIGGGGYAYWQNREMVNGLVNDLIASVNAPPPQQQTAPADGTAAGTAANRADAPATDNAATSTTKFTQRLQADGSEVDEGPAQLAGSEPVSEEGKSVAAQTEASRPTETADAGATAPDGTAATDTAPQTPPTATPPVATPPAADAQTTPPDQSTVQMPAGAQKMFLYEERLGQTAPTAIEGGVAWSLKEEAPAEGQRPEPVIQAQISVPDRGLTALMTIKRNADSSLPASHTIEFVFSLPENFEGGSIDSVQRVALKRTEQDRGDPLIAVPAKITDDFYMIALNDFPEAVTTNLDLLRTRNWIDVPLTYRNGRRALLTLEKGPAGTDAFDKALASWGNRPAGQ